MIRATWLVATESVQTGVQRLGTVQRIDVTRWAPALALLVHRLSCLIVVPLAHALLELYLGRAAQITTPYTFSSMYRYPQAQHR
jgi:hypothetical protein